MKLLRIACLSRAALTFAHAQEPRLANISTLTRVGTGADALAAAGLVAPELQITDDTTAISVPNFFRNAIFATATGVNVTKVLVPNYTAEIALATRIPALLDRLNRLNRLMCAGQMSAATRTRITTTLNALPSGTAAQQLERVQTALLLLATSPDDRMNRIYRMNSVRDRPVRYVRFNGIRPPPSSCPSGSSGSSCRKIRFRSDNQNRRELSSLNAQLERTPVAASSVSAAPPSTPPACSPRSPRSARPPLRRVIHRRPPFRPSLVPCRPTTGRSCAFSSTAATTLQISSSRPAAVTPPTPPHVPCSRFRRRTCSR